MDLTELKERQSWSLAKKIDHSLFTIETFLSRTDNNCYVGFSGGKDSTVLLDLVRIINKDIPAVFVNTGNEFPDIIKFVRHLRDDKGYNIIELHPKMTPREVWGKYGFPLVSKEQAEYIDRLRKNPEHWMPYIEKNRKEGKAFGVVSHRWEFLTTETFDTSPKCCQILKKNPSHKYAKESGRFPILGIMASESSLRTQSYIRRGGCNTFQEEGNEKPMSLPLSIWSDEDVWSYIRERNLEYCPIYDKGADRTGCVGCGFGCQFKYDKRFELLYNLYPKYYEMIMNYQNNGVTFREALRKVMAINGKELPDESGQIYFKEDYTKQ